MHPSFRRFLCAILMVAGPPTAATPAFGQPAAAPAGTAKQNDVPSFAAVRAIFAAKCLACHGNDAKDLKGELDLRSRASALTGGESGEPAIVPGEPDKSPLYRAIAREDSALQMPPKENDRLSAAEVELIRRWIAEGAKWDETTATVESPMSSGDAWSSSPDGIRIATSGGLSPEWDSRTYEPAAVWAYRPVERTDVPAVRRDDRKVHPIDAFLLKALGDQGIDGFGPPADRRTLIRRLTFDLVGLPPTPAEVEAFVADTADDAYLRLARRLLASPHYGEQQARHWLDVVRYADTAGFSNDFERPHAWRYRDYVIRSFNVDKPFDRFVTEQLAGDELEDSDSDPELLIAAGYLRMGPWEHTGMTVAAVTRQQYLDDVTNHVGVSLLAQGLRCAACHDHKFDPVPTRDYYRMQAIFAPVQFAERPAPFLASENTGGFDTAKAVVEQRLKQVQASLAALRQKNRDAIDAYLKERGVSSVEELPADQRPKEDYLGGTFGLTKTELSLRKIHQKSQQYLERELKRFEPFALSVYSGPPNNYASPRPLYDVPRRRDAAVPVVHILTGGSLESPADEVAPGVLSAMFRLGSAGSSSSAIPESTEGRRIALARWITSPNNTLTARVIVNRVWQQHFGQGLVATPNNFGKMGSKPTHPELLDWLAAWFVEEGWSLKKLHEVIVTSQAYRQSSVAQVQSSKFKVQSPSHGSTLNLEPGTLNSAAVDPNNRLLWRFPLRRLAAEEIRDSLLVASGELNREMGGPGVFPEINWEVALQPRHIMGSVPPAYVPSRTPDERNRRTIYAFRIRTLADPLLEVLNRPGSETSCERRDETTVTPQVFALFNSEFAANRALAMADRLTKEHTDDTARVRAAFQSIYGREATDAELGKCLAHIARMTEHHDTHPPTPTELPTRVQRGMVEELTGEMVHWDEDLSIMKDYQRDVMPWQVAPEVRALADVCLVLMNSNEFLYVR